MRRAAELFDERGLEAVGIRDVAAALGLSPGNVSYYFPRKTDLVGEFMTRLAERNEANLAALLDATDLGGLLAGYRRVMEAQRDYAFLTRSIVHVVTSDPDLAERYTAIEGRRRAGLAAAVTAMVGRDLRADLGPPDVARVVGTMTLVARFWTSEARLSFPDVDDEALIGHYLALLAHALAGVATEAGRRVLEPYLARVLTQRTIPDG